MAVDSTLLLREINQVTESGEGVKGYQVSCRIKTNSGWIDPLKVELIAYDRDYEQGYGDIVVVQLMMALGQYAYKLIPSRDELFVDLTYRPLYRSSTNTRDRSRNTRRYRAILMEQDNPGLVGRSPQASSQGDLDIAGIKHLQLQLVDEGLYQIRLASVGGLYRKVTPMQVLESILTETTAVVSTTNQQLIFGVDKVSGFNETVRDHIVVPHGTPLVNVKKRLQENEGGLYSTGVGCYLQGGHWYVYPLYDHTRWEKTPKQLTVISIPPNRYYGAELTYRTTSNQVVIITAGKTNTNDSGLFDQLNHGNGVRFTDSSKLLTFGETTNGKTRLARSDNLYEFQGVALKGGLTNAQWSEQRASSNPFKHYSEVAKRNGRIVEVEWMHGDSELLYPGMPVKYMTASNNKLLVVHGTLLGVSEQSIPNKAGPKSDLFVATVLLRIFIERFDSPV